MSYQHDYDAAHRATLDDWRRTQSEARLTRFVARQPRVFNKPGPLHPQVQAWADRYAAGEPGNLILVGNIGVGKSWHLWAIGRYLITRHHWRGSFEVATAYAMQRAIALPLDEDRMRTWLKASLLGLDDLGAQRISDWDQGHLAGLANDRSEDERPIMLTSNELDLTKLLDDRTASRLRENATIVKMAGQDRRKARQ
jgi:DNA replication protein DnaC